MTEADHYEECKILCNPRHNYGKVVIIPSHIQTLLSLPQVAIKDPDGDHATDFTSFSCPSRVALHSNSEMSEYFHFF